MAAAVRSTSAEWEPNGDEEDPALTALSSTHMPEDYRERSANLYADPKLRELKHYTKSHQHEQRLRLTAGIRTRPKTTPSTDEARKQQMSSLRFEGTGKMDRHLKHLAHERAMLPFSQQSKLPFLNVQKPKPEHICAEDGTELVRKQEDTKSLQTRLHWRAHMDHAVKSLLVDLELARDARLKEYSHQSRCDHLDKIYDWYLVHGMKEVRKERETPAHIRYNPDSPVMPGSMRVTPQGALSGSSSSPSLVAAGSLGLDAARAALRPSTSSSALLNH